jgi:hypothetical protein
VKVEGSIYSFFLDLGFLRRGTIWLNRGTMSTDLHRGIIPLIMARWDQISFQNFADLLQSYVLASGTMFSIVVRWHLHSFFIFAIFMIF